MIKPQDTQTAFAVMQHLASLAATPNVSAKNVELANSVIEDLITKIIKPASQELTATSSGLIVK